MVEMGSVFVGDGLCPANGAAGAPDNDTNASVYRQPRQRCALVRSAEPVSYNSVPPSMVNYATLWGMGFARRMAPQAPRKNATLGKGGIFGRDDITCLAVAPGNFPPGF